MNKKEFDAIIEMAIAAEVDAYEFYNEVAATVSGKESYKVTGGRCWCNSNKNRPPVTPRTSHCNM